MAVDVIAKTLGNFGKWHLRTLLIIFLCKIPTSWFMAVVIFAATAPKPGDYWCKPPNLLPEEYRNEWIQKAHPVKLNHGKSVIDYCSVYKDVYDEPFKYFGSNSTNAIPMTNETSIKCSKYEFAPDYHSLTADFQMFCGGEMLLPITQMFHIFGLLCGGLVAYHSLKLYV